MLIVIIIVVVVIILLLLWNYKQSTSSYENKEYKENKDKKDKKKITIGELVDDRINLRYISNFLTKEECEHLIEISKDKFAPSKVIEKDKDAVNNDRTSTSYYIPQSSTNIVKNLEDKIAKIFDVTPDYVEGLQIVKYEPNQFFKSHYDWFLEPYKSKINNQRQYTIFVYLNDVKGKGGETEFPKLNISFKPKEGDALFFENCKDENNCYDLALHQGTKIEEGIKYGLNIWIRFKPIV